jgi:hypothetical protein
MYVCTWGSVDLVKIRCCPTEDMIMDYMTKPLVSSSNISASSLWTSCLKLQSLPRLASRSVLDNIYQSLTQSQYSYNNHYDCKMTQMPINVLMNNNPKSEVIPQWKTNKMQNSSHYSWNTLGLTLLWWMFCTWISSRPRGTISTHSWWCLVMTWISPCRSTMRQLVLSMNCTIQMTRFMMKHALYSLISSWDKKGTVLSCLSFLKWAQTW